MYTLKQKLSALAAELLDHNNELMSLASETDDLELLQCVASSLAHAAASVTSASRFAEDKIKTDLIKRSKNVSVESVKEIQILADEFDKSGDEFLQKQASVLDQVLLNLGVARSSQEVAKKAEDAEVDRLRERRRSEDREEDYNGSARNQNQEMASEAAKAINKSIKAYRPLETSLSTRYCPDHPGAQVSRVADDTYQCVLDKKIYNWKEGFSTMKGNKVSGGDVTNQTQTLGDRVHEQMHFTTRENKLTDNYG